MGALNLIRHLDPEFARRIPPNHFERLLLLPVKALTAVLAWLTRRLP